MSLCLDAPGLSLAGAGEGHHHKNPIVTIIVTIYGASAGAVNIYSVGAVNVYTLQNDSPLPIDDVHWCVPLGLCGKLLSSPL